MTARHLHRSLALAASILAACGGEPTREPPATRTTPEAPREAPRAPARPLLIAGGAHTCVRVAGRVACWGKNDHAELDAAAARFDALAFGADHACGLALGRAQCWGANEHGQLGDATTQARAAAAAVDLPAGAFVEIAAGSEHTCARSAEGAIYCWGDNRYLQIGTRDGSAGDAAEADDGHELVVRGRRVPLDAPAEQLVVRGAHSCARLESGAWTCWGAHWMSGWLGDARYRQGRAPAEVSALAGAQVIALGAAFVCGVADGRVRCHGEHLDGQLGDPAADCCVEPPGTASVAGVEDAVAISASDRHACALRAGGSVVCWGADLPASADAGGDDRNGPRVLVPSGALELAAGSAHTCARFEGDRVACWGDDAFGQLGDGVSRRVARPVPAGGIDDAVELAVGYVHTCARSRASGVACWGALGERRHVAPLDAGRGLVAGVYESCAITGASEATCTGRGASGLGALGGESELAGVVRFDFEIAELATGSGGICARGRRGEVACVSEYSDAHVIRLSAPARSARRLEGGDAITALTVGVRACGVSGTRVRCWRSEIPMQSGAVASIEGAPFDRSFDAADPPAGVVVGEQRDCAWTRAGRVFCWQPPHGAEVTPSEPVPSLEGVVEMTAGAYHFCARTSSAVYCWGRGDRGQLGGGRVELEHVTTPVRVVDLPASVVQLGAGAEHTCARTEDGRVLCWGSDDRGNLGRDVPRAPRGPVDARGLSARQD